VGSGGSGASRALAGSLEGGLDLQSPHRVPPRPRPCFSRAPGRRRRPELHDAGRRRDRAGRRPDHASAVAESAGFGGRAEVVSTTADNIVSTTLGGGAAPGKFEASGAHNRVSLVLAGPTQLKVDGVGHVVEWMRSDGAPNPQITASGAQNVVKKKP
jgi:hypothetical protein